MRIVLFGDLHLYQLAVWPWQLLGKRLLGQTNLWLNRRNRFRIDLCDILAEKILSLNPDAILGTGDLTTTSLKDEFLAARKWIQQLRHACPVHLVPGNHDRYTFTSARQRYFERYLSDAQDIGFPYHNTLSPNLHLIGLDAAGPRCLLSWGKLGNEQCRRFDKILNQIPESKEHPLIIMCHYSLGSPSNCHQEPPSHGLRDLPQLTKILQNHSRPILYLHGHVHEPWLWRPDKLPHVIALNAGAPVFTTPRFPMGQGFWELDFADPSNFQYTHHALAPDNTWQSESLTPPSETGLSATLQGIT